tara:strand:+ start:591 stop:1325 length:735 start_codon:yes stop_codon:yes gene_type:complete
MGIELLILLIIFFLIVLQSIVGVGVLVIGTPILLMLNYSLIEIMGLLLPISICTSLVNLTYLKINKKKFKIESQKDYRQLFFLICIPSIFFGLYLLKFYEQIINFKYLVSLVIIFSYFLTKKEILINKITKGTKIFSLFLIGTIHGLTNSGGSLLSLMLSSIFNKNTSRYNITYFYFYLALSQYLVFIFLFGLGEKLKDFYYYFFIIPIGVYLGGVMVKYFDDKIFKSIISTIALLSAIVLLLM